MHRPTVEMVMGVLLEMMREGPVPAQVAVRRAQEMGANPRTLGAARRRLRVQLFRDGGRWFWTLNARVQPRVQAGGGCTLAPLPPCTPSALHPCTLEE